MKCNSRYFFAVAAIVGLFLVGQTVYGQEAAADRAESSPPSQSDTSPAVEPADTTAAAGQAKAEFDRKFEEYKAIVREIERLQTEYQSAEAAERESIQAAMAGQVAHAHSVMNEMVETGSEAYRAAPEANSQMEDFLKAVARYYAAGRPAPGSAGKIDGGDQYERALPIINSLNSGGIEDRELLVLGFLSAMMTNDYELAREYLQKAQQAPPTSDRQPADEATEATLTLASQFASQLDQYEQWWAEEAKIRAAEARADDLPRVKLTTTKGEITLELFENEAPQTVANFVTLVKQGYYDGSPFHRVLPKFMAQGGAKGDDGSGELSYSIRGEASQPGFRRHFRGSLSMGLKPGRPDSGGSQFFLTVVPTTHLDGEHTVFGRVIDGMEVLADLTRREPGADPQQNAALPEPDRILKAEVLRDRGHAYEFEKLPAS